MAQRGCIQDEMGRLGLFDERPDVQLSLKVLGDGGSWKVEGVRSGDGCVGQGEGERESTSFL